MFPLLSFVCICSALSTAFFSTALSHGTHGNVHCSLCWLSSNTGREAPSRKGCFILELMGKQSSCFTVSFWLQEQQNNQVNRGLRQKRESQPLPMRRCHSGRFRPHSLKRAFPSSWFTVLFPALAQSRFTLAYRKQSAPRFKDLGEKTKVTWGFQSPR